MPSQSFPRPSAVPDGTTRPYELMRRSSDGSGLVAALSGGAIRIPLAHSTHDFTAGETDPVTGLVPSGDYADFDMLECSPKSGLRIALSNPSAIKKTYLTVQLAEVPYSLWGPHVLSVRIETSTLGEVAYDQIKLQLGSNLTATPPKERMEMQWQYDGLNRRIAPQVKRAGVDYGPAEPVTIASYATDAWFRLARGIDECQASHQTVGTSPPTEVSPWAVDLPVEYEGYDTTELRIQATVQAGGALDVSIRDIVVTGVPTL